MYANTSNHRTFHTPNVIKKAASTLFHILFTLYMVCVINFPLSLSFWLNFLKVQHHL